jgi:hypothetical protein
MNPRISQTGSFRNPAQSCELSDSQQGFDKRDQQAESYAARGNTEHRFGNSG